MRRGKLLAAVYILSFMAGCQTLLFNPIGRMVPENKRISLRDSGEWTGVFKNEDMILTYKMVRASGILNISGTIHFTRRIAENFPVIGYFHLDAIPIDTQGKSLGMAGLTSVSYYYTEYITPSSPPLTFNTSISIPDSCGSMAFSYTGKAYDPADHDGGGMDFWEYPFE